MGYGHHVGALLFFFKWKKHPQEAYETTVTMSYPLGYAIKQKLSSVVIQHPIVVLWLQVCSRISFQFKSRSWLLGIAPRSLVH